MCPGYSILRENTNKQLIMPFNTRNAIQSSTQKHRENGRKMQMGNTTTLKKGIKKKNIEEKKEM